MQHEEQDQHHNNGCCSQKCRRVVGKTRVNAKRLNAAKQVLHIGGILGCRRLQAKQDHLPSIDQQQQQLNEEEGTSKRAV